MSRNKIQNSLTSRSLDFISQFFRGISHVFLIFLKICLSHLRFRFKMRQATFKIKFVIFFHASSILIRLALLNWQENPKTVALMSPLVFWKISEKFINFVSVGHHTINDCKNIVSGLQLFGFNLGTQSPPIASETGNQNRENKSTNIPQGIVWHLKCAGWYLRNHLWLFPSWRARLFCLWLVRWKISSLVCYQHAKNRAANENFHTFSTENSTRKGSGISTFHTPYKGCGSGKIPAWKHLNEL